MITNLSISHVHTEMNYLEKCDSREQTLEILQCELFQELKTLRKLPSWTQTHNPKIST